MNKYKITISAIAGFFLICALVSIRTGGAIASGDIPSFFTTTPAIGTATSTVSTTNFITPGTGTTTFTFAKVNSGQINPTQDVDSAFLLVQLKASTTATTLNWKYQWSNGTPGTDCYLVPTACDWYDEDQVPAYTLSQNFIEHASTTITHRWQPGNSTASTTNKILAIPYNASNYVRAVFSLPAGSPNATLFLQENSKRNAF